MFLNSRQIVGHGGQTGEMETGVDNGAGQESTVKTVFVSLCGE